MTVHEAVTRGGPAPALPMANGMPGPCAYVRRFLIRETMAATTSISLLVHQYANGDKDSLNRLVPLVYSELRRIAQRQLWNEQSGHTLQPTALGHEM